jgi:DNA-binding transcriptional MerR regulator
VLSLLQTEYPDVTISKIRFLESQGLLDPERTPSGYRKFYEHDIARLRWILRQQRENFLPLKVIKDRLDETPAFEVPADLGPAAAADAGATTPAPARPVESPVSPPPADPEPPAPPPAAAAPPAPPADTAPPVLDHGPTGVTMTRSELVSATGLTPAAITDLERYGLLAGRTVGNDVLYDEEAVVVAQLAAGFMRHGVEARHLRMYRTAADREAAFFEQLVMPILKQRNPAARQAAYDMLSDLARMGEDMRAAMLRQALRAYSGPR